MSIYIYTPGLTLKPHVEAKLRLQKTRTMRGQACTRLKQRGVRVLGCFRVWGSGSESLVHIIPGGLWVGITSTHHSWGFVGGFRV